MVPASDADVVGEVRLIGVAAVGGDRGEWDTPPGEGQRVAEAQDARQQLRAVAERVEGPPLQLAGRQPDRRGDRSHPLAAAGAANDLGERRVDHRPGPGRGRPRRPPARRPRSVRRRPAPRDARTSAGRPQHVERGPARRARRAPGRRGPTARGRGRSAGRRTGRPAAATVRKLRAIRPGDDEMIADPQQVHAAVGEHAAGGPVRLGRPGDRPGDRRRPLPIHDAQPATPDLGCP